MFMVTLDSKPVAETLDRLFLDGWKGLYLPVLKLLEVKLRPGAVIVADDLDIFPDLMRPYLEHVRHPGFIRVQYRFAGCRPPEISRPDGCPASRESPESMPAVQPAPTLLRSNS
jgi:hypothetical protein